MMMTNERKIWEAALLLVRRHGSDAVAIAEFDQAIQIGRVRRFDHGCPQSTARKMRIWPRLASLPLANR